MGSTERKAAGACAHLTVIHKRNSREGGHYDSWECDLCHTQFSPVFAVEPSTITIPMILRATGRTIPDLTGREHACEWQASVRAEEGNDHRPASAYPSHYNGQKPSWFTGQVPEETISSDAHRAWIKERQAQDPLNPEPIVLGTCKAFAHKHALHAETNFCEQWEESTFLGGAR